MESTKKILLFGSGMVAKSVLFYFSKYPSYSLTVASKDKESLDSLQKEISGNFKFICADIQDKNISGGLVEASDVVISLLPPPLHPVAAQYCLDYGKNFVTASYLTPAMQPFANTAKEKGLSFLFELGLDPGIDHIVTLKIIDEIRKKNGKVKNMYSFAGGLISPDCVDNPLGYKFSWSPIGVFKALGNDAVYLENGKEVKINQKDLLYAAKEYKINNALNIVYYPNRDSLKYRDLYNINEARTVFRGTLRYKGYCEIIAAFQELGLLKESKTNFTNWLDYINNFVEAIKLKNQILSKNEIKYIQNKFPGLDYSQIKFEKLLGALTSHKIWQTMTKDEILARLYLILDGLDFFEFLTKNFKLNVEKTVIENFVDHLVPFLTLKPMDSDTIIMKIKFDVEYPETFISEEIVFQFIMNGDKTGYSAMAKTVGIPASIGAKLILDGKINRKGLFGPFTPDVYNPLYDELLKEGLIPNYKRREFKPKL